MRERIFIAIGVALASIFTAPARGEVQAFYTFSSGLAPGGDGFVWPTPLSDFFYTPQGIGFGQARVDSGFDGLGDSRQLSPNNPAMWDDFGELSFDFGEVGVNALSFDVAIAVLPISQPSGTPPSAPQVVDLFASDFTS